MQMVTFLIVKGRSDFFLKLKIIKKILLALTILVSIPFGICGLLWGMVILSLLSLFINTHYSGKLIQYNGFEQVKDVLPIILISIIAGALTLGLGLIMMIFQAFDIFRLITGGLIVLLSYGTMAIVFKFQALQDLKNLIFGKI